MHALRGRRLLLEMEMGGVTGIQGRKPRLVV